MVERSGSSSIVLLLVIFLIATAGFLFAQVGELLAEKAKTEAELARQAERITALEGSAAEAERLRAEVAHMQTQAARLTAQVQAEQAQRASVEEQLAYEKRVSASITRQLEGERSARKAAEAAANASALRVTEIEAAYAHLKAEYGRSGDLVQDPRIIPVVGGTSNTGRTPNIDRMTLTAVVSAALGLAAGAGVALLLNARARPSAPAGANTAADGEVLVRMTREQARRYARMNAKDT
jgi:hypothetical protein